MAVFHYLVLFRPGAGEDPLELGRRWFRIFDEGEDRPLPTDAAGGRDRVAAVLAALEAKIADLDITHDTEADTEVMLSSDDLTAEWDLSPAFAVVSMWALAPVPKLVPTYLDELTRPVLDQGYDTIYDGQLDRLVTFPADTEAVRVAWDKAARAELPAAEHPAFGQPRGGFLSRLFGRS